VKPVRQLPVYSEHIDLTTCKRCGGACCKAEPGTAAPEDFGAPDVEQMRQNMLDALRSRRWVVGHAYRPFVAMDGSTIVVPASLSDVLLYLHPAQKRTGSCVFWSRCGCDIFETRPTGCRTLRPAMGIAGPECEQSAANARAFVVGWSQFQQIVMDVQKRTR